MMMAMVMVMVMVVVMAMEMVMVIAMVSSLPLGIYTKPTRTSPGKDYTSQHTQAIKK